MDSIPVVFCFDKSWIEHTIVSINSLVSNSSCPIKIYLIHPNSETEYTTEFFKKFSFNKQLVPLNTSVFYGWKASERQSSHACYLKLLIPDCIFEKKVIYLDSDVIVKSDIFDLYNMDLGNNLVGAVGNKMGEHNSFPIFEIKTNNLAVRAQIENEVLASHFMKQIYPNEKIIDIKQCPKISFHNDDVYINTGVLLMNLDLFRLGDSFNGFCEIYNSYKDCLLTHDQCIINKYTELRKTLIDSKWNYMINSNSSLDQFNSALNIAKIIHFASPNSSCFKPWSDSAPAHIRDFWNSYKNFSLL